MINGKRCSRMDSVKLKLIGYSSSHFHQASGPVHFPIPPDPPGSLTQIYWWRALSHAVCPETVKEKGKSNHVESHHVYSQIPGPSLSEHHNSASHQPQAPRVCKPFHFVSGHFNLLVTTISGPFRGASPRIDLAPGELSLPSYSDCGFNLNRDLSNDSKLLRI